MNSGVNEGDACAVNISSDYLRKNPHDKIACVLELDLTYKMVNGASFGHCRVAVAYPFGCVAEPV